MLNEKVSYTFPKNAQHENFDKKLYVLSIMRNANNCIPRKEQ